VLELALRYRREWSAPVPIRCSSMASCPSRACPRGFYHLTSTTGNHPFAELAGIHRPGIDPKDPSSPHSTQHRVSEMIFQLSSFRTRRAHSRSFTPAGRHSLPRPADEAEPTRAGDSCRQQGLAHSTIGLIETQRFQLVEIASRGIRALPPLTISTVRLGLQPPAERITARPEAHHEGCGCLTSA